MIRVLSDLHCAHPASLVEEVSQIEPLLEGAKQVVFNGDSVEWRLAKTRKRAEGFLESLKELCRQLGAEAVFLNGNHDAGISNLNHLKLMENRVLVTHGDIFFDGISPWAREAVRLRENHERLIRKHAPDSLEKQLWVMRQACLQTLPANSDLPERKLVRVWNLLADYLQPRKAREVWRAWRNGPALAAAFTEKNCPEVECVLMGHTHRAGHRFCGGKLVVNTGAFLPFVGRRVVEIDQNELRVRKVVRKGRRFFPGAVILRWSPKELVSLEPAVEKVQKGF